MYKRSERVFIISELHPQHGGDIDTITSWILQSKMAGANAVKVQLYDFEKLMGNTSKVYAEIDLKECLYLQTYANNIGIEFFASVFDMDRLQWAENIGTKYHKIASKVYENEELVMKAIHSGKIVFVSNGFNKDDFRYKKYPNVKYFACDPSYPTLLEDVYIPDKFSEEGYIGFSDHTIGITSVCTAISRGAMYIEKHFTSSKGMQSSLEKGHLGGMDFEDLRRIRIFADEYRLLYEGNNRKS